MGWALRSRGAVVAAVLVAGVLAAVGWVAAEDRWTLVMWAPGGAVEAVGTLVGLEGPADVAHSERSDGTARCAAADGEDVVDGAPAG